MARAAGARQALRHTIDVLVEIADRHGVSAAQVALAWLLGPADLSLLGLRLSDWS
jgi:aryl-alcohol dehydrogenase-like predicted oxidoreductase